MGRFKYSKRELEMNKVLLMNLELSQRLSEDEQLAAVRAGADDEIQASIAFLRSRGYSSEVDAIAVGGAVAASKPRPLEWGDLTAQAEALYPDRVELEDIMTPEEMQRSFEESEAISDSFSRKTSIVNRVDLTFLFVATALQVTKTLLFPYVAEWLDYGKSFDPSTRLAHDDKAIKNAQREANDKFKQSHAGHRNGKWINILYQSVPYDITVGSKELGINMGGKYHRMYTLGHDPILGWLFGTANILTDCITFNTLQTNRVTRIDPLTGAKRMRITAQAVPISMMLGECVDMIRADYLNLPAALFAQAQHLKSDEYTKVGLPVPLLAVFNETLASRLYREQYDALCFSRDAKLVSGSFAVSRVIDMVITLAHGLFRREDEDGELYEVRTRRLLSVSNAIASTSTCINAAITGNPCRLDIGGVLSTVMRLFSDVRFITKLKAEFISSELSERLNAELAEIDAMYAGR